MLFDNFIGSLPIKNTFGKE